MSAEELTNQVLCMRNIPATDKDVWMTFEVIEDGQLGELCTVLSTAVYYCVVLRSLLHALRVLMQVMYFAPQNVLSTPDRKFWNRCCSGATWPTRAQPTCW